MIRPAHGAADVVAALHRKRAARLAAPPEPLKPTEGRIDLAAHKRTRRIKPAPAPKARWTR